jgi:signal transduction histidine kinase
LHPTLSVCIYRILQEALQNVIRHGQAENVHVGLTTEKTRILLTITDDGVGFDTKQKATGLGLLSMQQRAESLGGEIEISSAGNAGTRINVRIPSQQKNLRDTA